jgi:hypothetical protein
MARCVRIVTLADRAHWQRAISPRLRFGAYIGLLLGLMGPAMNERGKK